MVMRAVFGFDIELALGAIQADGTVAGAHDDLACQASATNAAISGAQGDLAVDVFDDE